MPSAFICDAIRTPFGRYGGSLADVRTDDLAAIPICALLARNPSLDPEAINDLIYGCANQAGEDNRNVARMALLLAGLPERVPGATVNRLCGSSLEAAGIVARGIGAGEIEVAIAGGVESMSRTPLVLSKPDAAWTSSQRMEDTTLGWPFVNSRMKERYGVDSMAETAENVGAENGISRADQDAFAFRSQQRASAAIEGGRLAAEIVPVEMPRKKAAAADEHPRSDTTLEGLVALKPIVRTDGTVTAGNASGINDGAGALLVANERAAAGHGLTPRVRVVATAVAGVAPRVMGLGPVPAIRKALRRARVTLNQIDMIELNEAFAAQAAVLRLLGFPDHTTHVNADGGAIALGHPLGTSGARLLGAAVRQLHAGGGRFALCGMCIGVGQGIATLLERV
ncbi:beta-ketoadipyl CoA thiolase [Candidatus Sulfopaludibacter sp. SbA3]|nr:beta-ketoadipyl CoA thiolase [Candidatus Sulfopaludibacter sp. SbA3]